VAQYVQAGRDTGRHYSDVDPEAYVVLVMLLVITAIASSPVAAAALDRDGPARFDREIARIARASLFPPTSPSPTKRGEPPAPPTRSPKRKSAR
jgi:TetR/AcrR family transcriptional regulator